ncbi:putative methyltransferase-domain-containing protein [Xylariomycetidae sp. FL2044]|nr:putative methyltransferase-domain-containing protein [Xylariomycetidae sp. FL2044]KAH9883319.1 putative methyltransferase-domain-containing protein [Xylariomycetidae sp. FL2044]KAH9908861.1 putative methyltransferase-domain-containing protein [Xylariomycetidae sp. FL2044]
MGPARRLLPPSSSLPSLRSADLNEDQINSALANLHALYCPLPPSFAFHSAHVAGDAPLADSGYVSGNDDESDYEGDSVTSAQSIAALRLDAYERSFAERWLTTFIGRAEELLCFNAEEACQQAIEKASFILSSFFAESADEDDEYGKITREFAFSLRPNSSATVEIPIAVHLKDGLAGQHNADHTDVGLQSWGASIIFSELICLSPWRFRLSKSDLGPKPRIIELGAGTGLVSLVLADVLPHLDVTGATLIATDYHLAVLANLQSNVRANFTSEGTLPIDTCLLDWSNPVLSSPLDSPADMLMATDVIYEPKHAIWLRDCAARLLSPDGVFWLMATVRRTGRFEGISDTVEAAFTGHDGPRCSDGRALTILDQELLDKKTGIGRGDESSYKLFRIGWA